MGSTDLYKSDIRNVGEVNHFLSVTELEKFTHSFMDCCNVHCLGPSQKSISLKKSQLIKKKVPGFE